MNCYKHQGQGSYVGCPYCAWEQAAEVSALIAKLQAAVDELEHQSIHWKWLCV